MLKTYDHGPVDCREVASGCELRAGLIGHPYKQAVLPLSFAPDGALAPPPTITVSPPPISSTVRWYTSPPMACPSIAPWASCSAPPDGLPGGVLRCRIGHLGGQHGPRRVRRSRGTELPLPFEAAARLCCGAHQLPARGARPELHAHRHVMIDFRAVAVRPPTRRRRRPPHPIDRPHPVHRRTRGRGSGRGRNAPALRGLSRDGGDRRA